MPDYRIYQLNEDGHVAAPARLLTCADDREAEQEARKVLRTRPLEIWCGTRKVGTIQPNE